MTQCVKHLGLTNHSLSLLTGLSVGQIGLVTNLSQINLILEGGSRQNEVVMKRPDPAVTLQTGPLYRNDPEQEHQHQYHALSAPPNLLHVRMSHCGLSVFFSQYRF